MVISAINDGWSIREVRLQMGENLSSEQKDHSTNRRRLLSANLLI